MLRKYLSRLVSTPQRPRSFRPVVAAVDVLELRQLLSAVTVQLDASKDNTIYEADPDASNGRGEFLLAGSGLHSLVQFDIAASSIPAGSTIIDVVLTLNASNSTSGESVVSVHRVESPWGEAGSNALGDETTGAAARPFDATWIYSSYDGELWSSPGGDFGSSSASAFVSDPGAYEWISGGLIDDVQNWIDNPDGNFGWLLSATGGLASFISKDAPSGGLAPALEVTFEAPPAPPLVLEGRIWNDLNGDGVQNDKMVSDLSLQTVNGNSYFNAFGGDEYWFRSGADSRWYYLTPNGDLTQWSGVGQSLTGAYTATLDTRFYQQPALLDQNYDGETEPFLNGWTVELLDSNGAVIQTSTTFGIDLNRDGSIDPEYEGGWYKFEAPAGESYTVREVIPDGWSETAELTFSSSAPSQGAVNSPQLRFRNSFYENFGGLGERWMYSDGDGWYYITPDGNLYRWNGIGINENAPLTGTLVASPGVEYYEDPLLLEQGFGEPEQPDESISRTDFGVARAQVVRGRIWNDFYGNGQRDDVALIPYHYVLYPQYELAANEEWFFDYENNDWYIVNADGETVYWGPHDDSDGGDDFDRDGGGQFREFAEFTTEPWLNGRTVELLDSSGTVVATTVSRSIDLNNDGVIQLDTERGWYSFDEVPAGDYQVRLAPENGWSQTSPTSPDQTLAANLDAELNFRTTGSDFLNWGGRNERWIIDKDSRWYFILEDGALYRWTVGTKESTGGLQGTFVAQLTRAYYLNLNLLAEPEPVAVHIHAEPGTDPIELFFGSHRLLGDIL